jgi:glycerophosphoryl diester phosphodiesterase
MSKHEITVSASRPCRSSSARRASAARLGVLWHNADLPPMFDHALALGAAAVHPLWSLVDAALVAEARRRGLQVNVWTVNDPAAIAALADLGVDGIISDYPERLRPA